MAPLRQTSGQEGKNLSCQAKLQLFTSPSASTLVQITVMSHLEGMCSSGFSRDPEPVGYVCINIQKETCYKGLALSLRSVICKLQPREASDVFQSKPPQN